MIRPIRQVKRAFRYAPRPRDIRARLRRNYSGFICVQCHHIEKSFFRFWAHKLRRQHPFVGTGRRVDLKTLLDECKQAREYVISLRSHLEDGTSRHWTATFPSEAKRPAP